MRQLVVVLALLALLAGSAWADEVVLANGDVLHGDVTRIGDTILLEHAVLGQLMLEPDQVLSHRFERPLASPIAPVAAGAPTLDRGAAQASYVACAAPPCEFPEMPDAKVHEPGKRPWDLAFTLGISDESGNTEKTALNFDIEGQYRWRSINTLDLRLRTNYEESQGVQTEGKYHGSLRYARRVSPRGSLWAAWQVDRDDFADLLIRSGWFVGYKHHFIKREKTELYGGLGAGVVHEERVDVDPLTTAAFLGLAGYRHEFKHGDSFRADYWVTPYVDEVDRSPMRLELRYAHPLRNHFDVTLGFIWDYVPNPPQPDIRPWDTKFTVGLRWKP